MPYRRHSIKVLVLVLTTSICASEAVAMYLLDRFGPFTPLIGGILDIGLLMVLVIPSMMFTVFKPMSARLNQLITSEHLVEADQQIILADSIKRNSLETQLGLATHKIAVGEDQILALLHSLALAKDYKTGGHVIRTQRYLRILAYRLQAMGHFSEALENGKMEILIKVAPLHDIGKMGVSDAILQKAGHLTGDERKSMQAHALMGESILSAAQFEGMVDGDLISVAIKVAGGHHERWDGSGYPRGLAGNEISVEARIMAVADVYDALVSTRPYKIQWTHQEAVAEIVSKKNIHFDALVVDAFLLEEMNFLKIASELD